MANYLGILWIVWVVLIIVAILLAINRARRAMKSMLNSYYCSNDQGFITNTICYSFARIQIETHLNRLLTPYTLLLVLTLHVILFEVTRRSSQIRWHLCTTERHIQNLHIMNRRSLHPIKNQIVTRSSIYLLRHIRTIQRI
jgi:hypothetical protein